METNQTTKTNIEQLVLSIDATKEGFTKELIQIARDSGYTSLRVNVTLEEFKRLEEIKSSDFNFQVVNSFKQEKVSALRRLCKKVYGEYYMENPDYKKKTKDIVTIEIPVRKIGASEQYFNPMPFYDSILRLNIPEDIEKNLLLSAENNNNFGADFIKYIAENSGLTQRIINLPISTKEEKFSIEELDDRYILNGVMYRGAACRVEVGKEHLLERYSFYSQKEGFKVLEEKLRQSGLNLPDSRLYHSCLEALYDNKNGSEADLIEKVRRSFEYDLTTGIRTGSEVVYKSGYKDVVSHPCGVITQNIMGESGWFPKNDGFRKAIQAILGTTNLEKVENVYKWACDRKSLTPYFFRASTRDKRGTMPVIFSKNDQHVFLIANEEDGTRQARGFRVTTPKTEKTYKLQGKDINTIVDKENQVVVYHSESQIEDYRKYSSLFCLANKRYLITAIGPNKDNNFVKNASTILSNNSDNSQKLTKLREEFNANFIRLREYEHCDLKEDIEV